MKAIINTDVKTEKPLYLADIINCPGVYQPFSKSVVKCTFLVIVTTNGEAYHITEDGCIIPVHSSYTFKKLPQATVTFVS